MTVPSSAARPGNGALPGEIRVSRSGRPLKIAFVYSRLPLPMRRADQMTVAHLLAFLAARGHTIDFWTLDHGEPITDAQRAWLARQCRNVGLFRQWPWRIAWGVLRSLTTGRHVIIRLLISSEPSSMRVSSVMHSLETSTATGISCRRPGRLGHPG